ncbi:hypothetical protein BX661DRAFT_177702, partial [Kickxella alabastrina]|uniref:uncharacterized protein n=1 Tax=Kickxella alabastrina TaxID=61397 RepID=UPI0022201E2D
KLFSSFCSLILLIYIITNSICITMDMTMSVVHSKKLSTFIGSATLGHHSSLLSSIPLPFACFILLWGQLQSIFSANVSQLSHESPAI